MRKNKSQIEEVNKKCSRYSECQTKARCIRPGGKKDLYAHSGPPFSLYAPLSFFLSLSCFCVLAAPLGLVYSSGPLLIGNHSASSDGKSESSERQGVGVFLLLPLLILEKKVSNKNSQVPRHQIMTRSPGRARRGCGRSGYAAR